MLAGVLKLISEFCLLIFFILWISNNMIMAFTEIKTRLFKIVHKHGDHSKSSCFGPALFFSLSTFCSHLCYYLLLEEHSPLAFQTPCLPSLPPTLIPTLFQSPLLAPYHPNLNSFFFFMWIHFLCNFTEPYG